LADQVSLLYQITAQWECGERIAGVNKAGFVPVANEALAAAIDIDSFNAANTWHCYWRIVSHLFWQIAVTQRFEHQSVVSANTQQRFSWFGLMDALDLDAVPVTTSVPAQIVPLGTHRGTWRQHCVDAFVTMRQPAIRS
jgi:hypothetical protein